MNTLVQNVQCVWFIYLLGMNTSELEKMERGKKNVWLALKMIGFSRPTMEKK